jgi:hypothetical protein
MISSELYALARSTAGVAGETLWQYKSLTLPWKCSQMAWVRGTKLGQKLGSRESKAGD